MAITTEYSSYFIGVLPADATVSPLSSDVQGDLHFILKKNLAVITRHYASYVRCIRLAIQKMGVSVKELCAYLLTLNAFKSCHCDATGIKHFVDKEEKLEKATDINDIFSLLSKECASFFNYEIFEFIIDEYDIDRSQKILNYPEHLKAYINKHKLAEIHKSVPKLLDFTDDSKELTLKLDLDLTCTLGTVKERIEAIAGVLNLMPSTLRLLSIEEGCVIVILSLPVSVADAIFVDGKQFSAEQERGFQDLSVIWLKYEGVQKYPKSGS